MPGVNRRDGYKVVEGQNMCNSQEGKKWSRVCRRSKRKIKTSESLVIMYANIQGFTGKKTSLQYIMKALEADIVLLTETMTRKVLLPGCRCIYPDRSVGQNVAILLSGKVSACA